MLPEAMFFYLLTGKVPTQEQTDELVKDLATRSELPKYVEKIIDSFRAASSPALLTGLAIELAQPRPCTR
jgi:citrate synthase